MRFAAFGVLDYEVQDFIELEQQYGITVERYEEDFIDTKIDVSMYDAISILTLRAIPNSKIEELKKCKCIATRSIGYQYIDVSFCKSRGIVVTNASYPPYNVADFTIMLLLMLLRKSKISVCRALVNDFSLDGLKGKELRNMKVGILGTGKIGSTVIEELSGFGCKIYCYDLYQNPKVIGLAEYKSLDYILEHCDVISLHMPLTKENYHIIDEKRINKMKDGVLIINTARGGLIDTDALIDGIESLHIGGVALDTIEGEEGVSHEDLGAETRGLSQKKSIMYLKQFPNVIFTQHYAFFTEEAVRSMIECSFFSMLAVKNNTDFKNRVN